MSDEEEIESITSRRFEAVQIAMTKDKNGFILKLSIHPDDAPEDLLRDPVGTRYVIVAVKLDDEDQPVVPVKMTDGQNAVKMAAMLCADQRFQGWLCQTQLADEMSEDAARNAVRTYCGVKSRADLRVNEMARKRFLELRSGFEENLRSGKVLNLGANQ